MTAGGPCGIERSVVEVEIWVLVDVGVAVNVVLGTELHFFLIFEGRFFSEKTGVKVKPDGLNNLTQIRETKIY